MIASRARFMIMLLLMVWVTQPCKATVVLESTPQSLAARAGVIFAGTVASRLAEYQGKGGTIVTKYTFRDLVFAKGGSSRDSLVLVLAGANFGKRQLIVDGQPAFEVGERYIVLSYSDLGSPANSYMPVVGLHQGMFRVTPRGSASRGTVMDSDGNPIVRASPTSIAVSVADTPRPHGGTGRVPVVVRTLPDERAPHIFLPSKDDPGTRLSERDFLDFLSALR